jgi:hypothetical protein
MKEIPNLEGRPAVRFDPEIRMRMGQQLRVLYGDVMNEGVPDRCQELLHRLDWMHTGAARSPD